MGPPMLKLVDSSRDENDVSSLSLDELARLGAKKLLAEALHLISLTQSEERHVESVKRECGGGSVKMVAWSE